MAITSETNTFYFPPLKLKKHDLKPMNFKRICFQFQVGRNNECTLIGHKLMANRICKPDKLLLVLTKDTGSLSQTVRIKENVLFVQLELSKDQIERVVGDTDGNYLHFTPQKREIGKYRYVIYMIITNVAGSGTVTVETNPCPPAKPPGHE